MACSAGHLRDQFNQTTDGFGFPPHTNTHNEGSDTIVDVEVLIVLDNCEDFIDAAAELAERIMNEAPQTHILATSREAGTRVYERPAYYMSEVLVKHCDTFWEGVSVRRIASGRAAADGRDKFAPHQPSPNAPSHFRGSESRASEWALLVQQPRQMISLRSSSASKRCC